MRLLQMELSDRPGQMYDLIELGSSQVVRGDVSGLAELSQHYG